MKKIKEIVKSKGFDVTIVSGKDKELYADSLAPKGKRGDTFLEMYKSNIDLIVDNLKWWGKNDRKYCKGGKFNDIIHW